MKAKRHPECGSLYQIETSGREAKIIIDALCMFAEIVKLSEAPASSCLYANTKSKENVRQIKTMATTLSKCVYQ